MQTLNQIIDQTNKSAAQALVSSIVGNQQSENIPAVGENISPDFNQYASIAQKYLQRPIFRGTPITGQMLADAARNTYERTGKLIPVDLALAQGQLESHLGTRSKRGKNAITNPYNVGEFDSGTKMKFNTTQDGVNAYYNLMANDYLKNSTPDDLMYSFVNSEGNRYASNPDYENIIKKQREYISNYVR